MSKRSLITLGDDGEIALRLSNGSTKSIQNWNSDESLVYLVIDCSGSMTGKKFEQAKRGALDFAKTAFTQDYQVGLISFSDDTSHLCSPIVDSQQLALSVNKLSIQGGTNLTPAIKEVIGRFYSHKNALRAMVIVTDGQTVDPKAAISAAEIAKAEGISILTIGTDDADAEFLSKLASEVELSKKVSSDYLESAISNAAKLLPKAY